VTLFLSASDRPQSGRFRDQPGERPAARRRPQAAGDAVVAAFR